MEQPKNPLDSGWQDCITSSLSSNKGSASSIGWAQYRVKNGVLYFRGSVQRNSGTWAAGDVICRIPGGLFANEDPDHSDLVYTSDPESRRFSVFLRSASGFAPGDVVCEGTFAGAFYYFPNFSYPLSV